MKRGNRGFAEELLFRENIIGETAVKDQRGIHSVEMIKGEDRSPQISPPSWRFSPTREPTHGLGAIPETPRTKCIEE